MTNTIEKVYKNGTAYSFKDPNLNTKTFTLSGTSDLTTAQAIYDYYVAGNNPIMVHDDSVYVSVGVVNGSYYMESSTGQDNSSNSYSNLGHRVFIFALSSGTVTNITTGTTDIGSYLSVGVDYSTPYTPEYNGSPATKKYVDDNAFSPTSSGTTGQVLMKTAGGYDWAAAPATGIQNDTTGTTTTVSAIRCGTEAEYNSLGTYSQSTIYHIY